MIDQFPTHAIELMVRANESALRVVCLPLSSHFKDRAADFTAPDLPQGWDINTSFIFDQIKKISGDGLILRYTSQSSQTLGLRAFSPNSFFSIAATLNKEASSVCIHQTLGAEICASPNHFYEAYTSLMNMFSAMGFTTIETESSGTSLAHQARAGFEIVPADRQEVYDSIDRALIKYTSPHCSHETELRRNGPMDLEDTLIEWSRDIDLFGDETARKLLSNTTARMWFDATNMHHVEQFKNLTYMLVTPNARHAGKADVRLSLVP